MSEIAPLDLRQPQPRLAAKDIANLLISGKVGRPLLAELYAKFGDAPRSDVYLAIAMASTIWEADQLVADAEVAKAFQVTGA